MQDSILVAYSSVLIKWGSDLAVYSSVVDMHG